MRRFSCLFVTLYPTAFLLNATSHATRIVSSPRPPLQSQNGSDDDDEEEDDGEENNAPAQSSGGFMSGGQKPGPMSPGGSNPSSLAFQGHGAEDPEEEDKPEMTGISDLLAITQQNGDGGVDSSPPESQDSIFVSEGASVGQGDSVAASGQGQGFGLDQPPPPADSDADDAAPPPTKKKGKRGKRQGEETKAAPVKRARRR